MNAHIRTEHPNSLTTIQWLVDDDGKPILGTPTFTTRWNEAGKQQLVRRRLESDARKLGYTVPTSEVLPNRKAKIKG